MAHKLECRLASGMPRKRSPAYHEKHRAHARDRYRSDADFREAHRARVRINDERYRTERQALMAEFRAAGCTLCPEREACCLSAHHTDPATKEFSIGDAERSKVSPERLRRELAKCACLCENCHRKVHAGLLSLELSRGSSNGGSLRS